MLLHSDSATGRASILYSGTVLGGAGGSNAADRGWQANALLSFRRIPAGFSWVMSTRISSKDSDETARQICPESSLAVLSHRLAAARASLSATTAMAHSSSWPNRVCGAVRANNPLDGHICPWA